MQASFYSRASTFKSPAQNPAASSLFLRPIVPRINTVKKQGRQNARADASASEAAWDRLTDRLVGSASIPFSILVLPQVVQNLAFMQAGNTAALSIISWEVRGRC